MARVMIKCPESDKPVYTGMNFSYTAFDSVQIDEKSVYCAKGGRVHYWRWPDAYLEDDGGES